MLALLVLRRGSGEEDHVRPLGDFIVKNDENNLLHSEYCAVVGTGRPHHRTKFNIRSSKKL